MRKDTQDMQQISLGIRGSMHPMEEDSEEVSDREEQSCYKDTWVYKGEKHGQKGETTTQQGNAQV